MKLRDKEKFTRDNVIEYTEYLEKKLADILVSNRDELGTKTFNSAGIQRDIGALMMLRNVILK